MPAQSLTSHRLRLAPIGACLLLACVSGTGLFGCGSSTKVESRSTTTGQELQDLEDARNKGLLTEEEYQKKRAEILKSK